MGISEWIKNILGKYRGNKKNSGIFFGTDCLICYIIEKGKSEIYGLPSNS